MPPCEGPASVVHDPRLVAYDFGPGHPMSPVRVDLTMRLAAELGVLDGVRMVPAPVADEARLLTVHTPAYVEAVRRLGAGVLPEGGSAESYGLGTEDNPVFPGMHEATAHVVGATVEACRQVWSGESLHSANVSGGLHHAMPGHASGFCVYNDVAVAITSLLEQGAERVAYVDVDAHHGDGVQHAFWDDPRVLTISLHESGAHLFPGTGHPGELGGPDAEGYAVNVALPPGTTDGGWRRAFHAVVPDLLREFDPEVLVSQHGCDSHALDPMAHLSLSVDGQRATALDLHDLAHEVSDGRWVATGGGGYALIDVVPRTWTHLLAVLADHPIDPGTPLPVGWREHVAAAYDLAAPALMGDLAADDERLAHRPWEGGYDPDSVLDQAIRATRTAAFPCHGLDPLP